jgi:hypothetical protein
LIKYLRTSSIRRNDGKAGSLPNLVARIPKTSAQHLAIEPHCFTWHRPHSRNPSAPPLDRERPAEPSQFNQWLPTDATTPPP